MTGDLSSVLAGSDADASFADFLNSRIGDLNEKKLHDPYYVSYLCNETSNAFHYQYFWTLARLTEVCLTTEEKHGVVKLKLVNIVPRQ